METLDASLMTWMTETADRYADAMPGTPAASYLQSRGIDLEVARQFRLGYVAEPGTGHEPYRGMLCIPYVTVRGVNGYKFRRLNNDGTRYLCPTGSRTHIYNVTALLKYTPTIVICEGELDAVTVHGVCGIPAVGVPGVSNWKRHFSRLFDGVHRILVLGDNDEKADGSNPGQDFAKRVCEELPHAVNVLLPPGMDANQMVVSHGADSLKELLGIDGG
jgi:DNA primase